MMVNPSGVQLDMLNSVAGNEDSSVDWVWESAGRLTPTGYVVEIRLPLRSIRFASGETSGWGCCSGERSVAAACPWRGHRSNRASGCSRSTRRSASITSTLACRATSFPASACPNTRTGPRRRRGVDGPGERRRAERKIGLTTQVAVDATVNPDFSQVESDAFQVDVNQRFPVFYSEKRPFFMEGAGIFMLAGTGNGDNSMQRAVHTRRIVDPIAGAKLTGSQAGSRSPR